MVFKKNMRERERASCLQYYSKHTRSLQKFGKKITETSNGLQALEKEISKCFLTRAEAFNEGGFVMEEDLSKLNLQSELKLDNKRKQTYDIRKSFERNPSEK